MGLIVDHANAVLGLLRAGGGLTVFPAADGATGSTGRLVPNGTEPPYVAVHIHGGPRATDSLQATSTEMELYFYLHAAGATQLAAQVIADLALSRVLDVVPTIAGRTCWPIRYEADRPERYDDTATPAVWTYVTLLKLRSVAATP